MAYSPPTYRTRVILNNGPRIGVQNPTDQPGGFVKGLPSPLWCQDSIQWQLLFYTVDEYSPAQLEGLTATLSVREYNTQNTATPLATAPMEIGEPGYYNSTTLFLEARQLAELSYSGKQMMLYVEVSGSAEVGSSSGSSPVQHTVYQAIEFIGSFGDQSEVSYAPVPAGRWMGDYDATTEYWPYDTVIYGYGIWMNITSGGSEGIAPPSTVTIGTDPSTAYWQLIVYDWSGAWLESLSSSKQDGLTTCAPYTGTVSDFTYTYLDGLLGTFSSVWTWIKSKLYSLFGSDGALLIRSGGTVVPVAPGTADQILKISSGLPSWGDEKTLSTLSYTPADGADWPDPDPATAKEALDTLAERMADTEDSVGSVSDAVLESDFGSYTVLAEQAAGPPATVKLYGDRILGRLAAGQIAGLTVDQVRTLLNVSGLYRTLGADASSLKATQTNGAEAVEYEYGSNTVNIDAFAFDDTTEESVEFWWTLPLEIDLSHLKMSIFWRNTAGNSGESVTYGISARAYADGDALDQALSTEVTVTDDWSARDSTQQSPWSAQISPAGSPAAGQRVLFKITRKSGSDSLTGDADMLGLVIQYKESDTAPSPV